jgi:phosphatidate cytidylyltransferase
MKRIITAVILIAAVLALILLGEPWMISIFAAVAAILAAYEYRQLAHQAAGETVTGVHIPLWWLGGSALVIFFFTMRLPDFELPVLTLLTFILLAWSGFRAPLNRVLFDTSLGLFGLIYIVYPLTLIPLIKAHEDGIGLLIFLFTCVWTGDIAALYIGRNFGRRKLTSLSPNKTWEGTIASIAAAILCGMGVYYLGIYLTGRGYTTLHIGMAPWQMILLAAVLNVAAQLGDLLESAIKRGAGVKDSGTMLPGHGGILDRIDALLLAAPVLWYILLLKDWQTLFR